MSVSSNLRNPRLLLPSDPAFNQKIQELFSKAGLVYQPPVEPEASGLLTDIQGKIPAMDVVHMTPGAARECLKNYRADLAIIHEHEIRSNDGLWQRVALPHSLSAEFTVTATRRFSHSMSKVSDLGGAIIGTTYPEFLQAALNREGLQARVVTVPRENLVEALTKGGLFDAAFDHAKNVLTAPQDTPTGSIPDVILRGVGLNSRAMLVTPRMEATVGVDTPLSMALMERLTEILPHVAQDTRPQHVVTKIATSLGAPEQPKTFCPIIVQNHDDAKKGWRLPSFLRSQI